MKYILLLLMLSSCYAISVTTVCYDDDYKGNVSKYYYENQFNVIPQRKVHVFVEAVDTTVIFLNTPKKYETTIVFTDREMTFKERDAIVKKALDYVLRDIK